ncbi:hypothetical protein WBP07_29460 [Novosphingobium sp. BL-8A]|uniref:ABC transporter permease subunit n=1 Tax=Novosphingobium sp. BL-8A TaxID=3127639 RepID=UPI003757EF78
MSAAASPRTSALIWLACLPALAISLGLLFAPFGLSLWRSVFPGGAFDLSAYASILDSSFRAVLSDTLRFAALVTLACLLLGTPTAYALVRYSGWARRVMLVAMGVSFTIGTLIRSYAWLAILGSRGLVNSALHVLGWAHPVKLAFTDGAMLLASVQVTLPLFILPLYGVMQGIDLRMSRAARSLGADPVTAWLTAVLPLALPGIGVSCALVFLTCLGFYAIPTLLGAPDSYLLSQELEVRINTLGDDAGASARIVVMFALVLLSCGLATILRSYAQRAGAGRLSARLLRSLEPLARVVAPWRWVPVGMIFVFVLALLLVPLVILAPLSLSDDFYLRFPPRAYSLRWIETFLGDPDLLGSAAFTLRIAISAAAIASLTGAMAALASLRLPARRARLVTLAVAAPLVVSPITVTAALYLVALRWSGIESSVLFVAIYAVTGLPYGFLLVGAAARRLDPHLARAAATLGAGPLTSARTVTMPLLATAFASAFVFAFLLAVDDISAGLFLSSSDAMPLALRLWEDLKAAITPLPAAITMLAALIAMAIYCLARMAAAMRRHAKRWDAAG